MHSDQVQGTDLQDVGGLLEATRGAASRAGFRVEVMGEAEGYPLYVMTRPAYDGRKGLWGERYGYLSSGVHGDEPAGPLALLRLLEEDALPRTMHWTVFPVICPANLARGERSHPNGVDPNRDYLERCLPEVAAHVAWMEQNLKRLDCAFLLHEDWESAGFYVYELLARDALSVAAEMLAAAEESCGVERAPVIEGLPADGGLISFRGVDPIRVSWPEAVWLARHGAERVYTLETPSSRSLEERVEACCQIMKATWAKL